MTAGGPVPAQTSGEGQSAAPESTRSRRRPPAGAGPWIMSAATAIAVLLTALNLQGVLRGMMWLPPLILTIVTVLACTAAARALRAPAGIVPLAGTAGLVGILHLQFLPAAGFLGVFPTSKTLEELQPLLQQANEVVISQVAPVQALPGIVLLTCAGLGVVVLLVDILASSLRMPSTSGLGLIAVLLVPAIVKHSSIGAAGFAAAITGFLLLLASAHWTFGRPAGAAGRFPVSQLNRALTIGAAGIVAALLVPLAIPGFSSGLFPEGSRLSLGTSSGLNPMITLGNDLRNPGSAGRMTYVTTSEDPVYLRAVTLEDFSGDSWAPDTREDSRETGVTFMGDVAASSIDSIGEINTTIINTGDFVSPWLPTPYAPIEVSGLEGTWSYDPLTLSILGEHGASTADQRYTVRSVTPELTPQTLAAANEPPAETFDARFLTLPDNLPEEITATVEAVTDGIDNRYHKAMAIQQYLRSPEFVYSETAPVEGGYDGNSMDVVGRFLQEKSGYCVHYSSAMAVMARAEGIPSRIAVGYAPGTSTGETVPVPRSVRGGVTELPQFAVDSDDAHAWPELYFEGMGWVPFEPTPSRGVVPDYAQAETTGPNEDQDPGNLNPDQLADQDRDADQQSEDEDEPAARGSSTVEENASTAWLTGGLITVLFVVLAAAPYLLRQRRYRRRLHRLSSSAEEDRTRALLAWREVNDAAADHGAPAQPSETPRGFSARLGREQLLGAEASEAMRRLVYGYERAAFGPPGPPVPRSSEGGAVLTLQRPDLDQRVQDVQLVRESLSSNSSAVQRLRARWLPVSLWQR